MTVNGKEFSGNLIPVKNEDGSFSFVGVDEKHIYTIKAKEKSLIIEAEEIEQEEKGILDFFTNRG